MADYVHLDNQDGVPAEALTETLTVLLTNGETLVFPDPTTVVQESHDGSLELSAWDIARGKRGEQVAGVAEGQWVTWYRSAYLLPESTAGLREFVDGHVPSVHDPLGLLNDPATHAEINALYEREAGPQEGGR